MVPWRRTRPAGNKASITRQSAKPSPILTGSPRLPDKKQEYLAARRQVCHKSSCCKVSALGVLSCKQTLDCQHVVKSRTITNSSSFTSGKLFTLCDCRHLARWGGGTQNCYPRLTVCQVTEARGATLDISQRHVEDAYHPGFSVCCDAEEAFVSFGCATVERNEKLLPQLLIVRRIPERLPSCPCKHICVPWEVLLSYNENLSKVIMGTAPHCPSGRCPAGCATQ
jgi:hypothetical protein